MGSRLRENPEKLFEVFLEIAKPEGEDSIFLQKYPADFNEELVLKPIPKFAFPCASERYTTKVDHFTFVLTDLESKYKFGYCRHAQGNHTCLCIVSCLPWFDVFYTILNKLAEMINTDINDNNVTELLRVIYANGVPTPGVPVQLIVGQDMLNFTAPDLSKLPSIPSNRNLTEYYSAVDTENMTKVFASMLHERRILFVSKKLSRLTACIHASTNLLYPMHWQHLFIPILPPQMLDYVTAPMPYVMGIHSSVFEEAKRNDLTDAVILDVDTNTLTSEYDDLDHLPSEVASYLKRHLKKDKVMTQMSVSGDVIPKAFMQALIRLIGGYRDALKFHPGEPITFDPEAFVQSRPASMQPFLESMFELQIFQQFINDRLDMLNLGKGFSDIFEMEAMQSADKYNNTSSKYKEWMSNMKKQGKQFQKNSKTYLKDFKDKIKDMDFSHKQIYNVATKVGTASLEFSHRHINNMRTKAAPVVSSAMHHMKKEGKKFYKGVRKQVDDIRQDMKKDEDHHRTKSVKHSRPDSKALTRNRPATVIHGAELKTLRPPRPGTQPVIQITGADDKVSKYKLISLADEHSVDDSEAELSYNRVSVNLLSDPDIQVALNKSKSISAEDLGTSPFHHSFLMSDSEVSSIDSYNISGRASPAQHETSYSTKEETSSISSTSTFDSANIPYIDTSDGGPVAPPRKNKRHKPAAQVADRLIGGRPSKPPPEIPKKLENIGKPNVAPKPAPRKSLSKDSESQKELSPGSLIDFDSPEYVDVFDPFSTSNVSTVGREDLFSSPENSPFKQGSLSEANEEQKKFHDLNRTPAFRKAAFETPKRDFCKPDISPSPEKGSNSPANQLNSGGGGGLFDTFDPLISESEKLNISGNPQENSSNSQDMDLFHSWNINHLKPASMNTSSQLIAGGRNSPGCRQPVGVTTNPIYGSGPVQKPATLPRPKTIIGNTVHRHNLKPAVVSNPNFTAKNSSSGPSLSEVKMRNSDPFSDLHEISITNRKSQEEAQKRWEKFDDT